ncbi:MAG: hypothetical protein NTY53_25400 [Kiritimatiellaeota bacterium]|nr:hypothetical protein [Kiritimatiellota bacterium]
MQTRRVLSMVVLCVLATGFGACKRSDAPEAAAPTAATAVTKFDKLLGRWARTDGEYTLELRAVDAAGKLSAGYLNPSVINVEKAEASAEGDRLKVFVVLRDVNYPGCTYKLAYDKEHDALVGDYFQAMQQQTYEVAFTRLK